MTMKEKVKRVLRGKKLTVKEITNQINEIYHLNTTEAIIRTIIWRLKTEDKAIEKCGIDNRYKIYKLINEDNKKDSELMDKLVLLMVKAGINSEEYGVDIQESEIESNIQRLMESGKIG